MPVHLQYMWNPDSGTHELPAVRRGLPLAEQFTHEIDTTELAWWEPKPSVPTRVERSDRLRHLRASIDAAFWPAVLCAGVIVALLIIAHLQGVAPVSSAGIR